MSTTRHHDLIIDQFTRQATPFAEKPEHRDAVLMKRLLDFSGVTAQDSVLDVACGPGLVACAFAERAREVTGMDLTPAMIEKARRLQEKRRLKNLTWDLDNSEALPYPYASFSMVVTRYSFHHFTSPLQAWREMVRVCRPGGTVLVADVAVPAKKATVYDSLETLRDPSHTHAMILEQFPDMARQVGLTDIRTDFFRVAMEADGLIDASFPEPGNDERLRELLRADLGKDKSGFEIEMRGQELWLSFPTMVVAGRKA